MNKIMPRDLLEQVKKYKTDKTKKISKIRSDNKLKQKKIVDEKKAEKKVKGLQKEADKLKAIKHQRELENKEWKKRNDNWL